MKALNSKRIGLILPSLFLGALCAFGADAQFDRAKLEIVVEQAGELLAEANRKDSATHTAAHRYFFGLIYGSGTNLLARKDSPTTKSLQRKYMDLIGKSYDAYTRVEEQRGKAVTTGRSGTSHRAKRIANAEKLGDEQLKKGIKQWESFATQLKKTR